jgi:hypothetical protein
MPPGPGQRASRDVHGSGLDYVTAPVTAPANHCGCAGADILVHPHCQQTTTETTPGSVCPLLSWPAWRRVILALCKLWSRFGVQALFDSTITPKPFGELLNPGHSREPSRSSALAVAPMRPRQQHCRAPAHLDADQPSEVQFTSRLSGPTLLCSQHRKTHRNIEYAV